MANIFEDIEEMASFSRLRTPRRRKQAVKKDRDKQLIRLYKEDQRLRKQHRDLPMMDLLPPVQKGWKRYFVLRDDVRQSALGTFYEQILQKINTTQYSSEKVFKQKKKRLGKRIYVEKTQKLHEINAYELPKLKLTDKELACFEWRTAQRQYGNKTSEILVLVFTEPWRFVLRVRPNIITKIRAKDSELEQRMGEINAVLYDNYANNGRLHKLRGRRGYKNIDSKKYANPLKNLPTQEILDYFQ